MEKGDFIKINFTGKIKEAGKVFDTNKKEVAEKEGFYSNKINYEPVLAIVGENYVINGVDESFLKHSIGDEYTINVPPEKGFGERNPELIKLVPMRIFKEKNIVPFPGLTVNIDGMIGIIRSISGGRITVDFNHPLAGKELVYEIKILEKITNKDERVKSLISFYTGFNQQDFEIEFLEKTLRIKIKKEAPKFVKEKITDEITDKFDGIEKVEFVEEFSRKK